MSNDENGEGPRDVTDAELGVAGGRSISEIFGAYNVLGSDVEIIIDGRQVTCPINGS